MVLSSDPKWIPRKTSFACLFRGIEPWAMAQSALSGSDRKESGQAEFDRQSRLKCPIQFPYQVPTSSRYSACHRSAWPQPASASGAPSVQSVSHAFLRVLLCGCGPLMPRGAVHGQNPDHMSPCCPRNGWKRVRPGGVPYAIEAAMLNSISVPAPTPLQISNLPPICLARSRIPRTP
jgi:hypothetical protein